MLRANTDRHKVERRRASRYRIDVELQYRLLVEPRSNDAGRGRTLDMSTSGLLFESEASLPSGRDIELSLAWPAELDNGTPLKMWIIGQTVRAQGNRTAVLIKRHEFRVRGGSAGTFARRPLIPANGR